MAAGTAVMHVPTQTSSVKKESKHAPIIKEVEKNVVSQILTQLIWKLHFKRRNVNRVTKVFQYDLDY